MQDASQHHIANFTNFGSRKCTSARYYKSAHCKKIPPPSLPPQLGIQPLPGLILEGRQASFKVGMHSIRGRHSKHNTIETI